MSKKSDKLIPTQRRSKADPEKRELAKVRRKLRKENEQFTDELVRQPFSDWKLPNDRKVPAAFWRSKTHVMWVYEDGYIVTHVICRTACAKDYMWMDEQRFVFNHKDKTSDV